MTDERYTIDGPTEEFRVLTERVIEVTEAIDTPEADRVAAECRELLDLLEKSEESGLTAAEYQRVQALLTSKTHRANVEALHYQLSTEILEDK